MSHDDWAQLQYEQWEIQQDWHEELAARASAEPFDVPHPADNNQFDMGFNLGEQLATGTGASSSDHAGQDRQQDVQQHDGWHDDAWFADDDDGERAAAAAHGIPWKERGPPAPDQPTSYWNGHRWRPTTQRWSRRGGSNRDWWDCYYRCVRQGATKDDAKVQADRGHPKAD